MTLVGHVYRVTNPLQAFAPVILNNAPPTSGFIPWPGATVTPLYAFHVPSIGFLPIPFFTTANVAADGSFSLAIPPAGLNQFPIVVSLSVTSGVGLYRSGYISLSQAQSKELNLWLYPDTLPTSDGISAGTISQQVSGQGLPGNTIITAGGPYGLNFSGSEGQVSINFNIWTAANISPNLKDFLDLSINGWDINVGWPTSWGESANNVLNKIKSGIAGTGSSINTVVLQRMEGLLESQEGLSASVVSKFLNQEVSVTFYGIGYPHSHSWGIGHTSDKTIVLTANPCIGYPRSSVIWEEPKA